MYEHGIRLVALVCDGSKHGVKRAGTEEFHCSTLWATSVVIIQRRVLLAAYHLRLFLLTLPRGN